MRHMEKLEQEDREQAEAGGPEGDAAAAAAGMEGSVRAGGGSLSFAAREGSVRGGAGGSLRGGSYAGGSLRGAMTALEALRRARERRSLVDMGTCAAEVRTTCGGTASGTTPRWAAVGHVHVRVA